MNGLLLHSCCAPCSIACVEMLRADGVEPTALWYNPNIHPYSEYAARRDCLIAYSETIGLALHIAEDYGLRPFVRAVAENTEARCSYCYALRLDYTAQYAAAHGFEAFTSTLLVSPYQNHALLVETAERAAERYGVRFAYYDFRPGFREGQTKARENGLYMQKYCGCIFSEEDRYRKKIDKDIALRGDAHRILEGANTTECS